MEHRFDVARHRRFGLGLLAACIAVGLGVLVLTASAANAKVRFAPPARHAVAASHVAKAGPRASAAASGCWGTGPTVKDYRGYRYATRYCHNYRGGQLHLYAGISGYLYAGNNWFVCQSRLGIENPHVGSARNNIWLYTQGDVGYSYHGWGWFPATYVSGGVNYGPIPGLRWC